MEDKDLINATKLFELVITDPGTASDILIIYIEFVDELMNYEALLPGLKSESWKNYHTTVLKYFNKDTPKE